MESKGNFQPPKLLNKWRGRKKERKNRVIQEMARVMLLNKQIPQKFWGEAVNTSCHIGNRIFFQVGTKKTAYEIWNGKKPKVKYFRVFRSKCYILNDRENLGKFDVKSDEGIFLGYSTTSRAYRVFNKRTKTVMDSINVKIDDALTKVEMIDDGEGSSIKEPDVEVEALYTGLYRHFYMTHVHTLRGSNSTSCTFVGGESYRGDAYTKGEKTFFYEKTLFYFMLVFSLLYGALSYV